MTVIGEYLISGGAIVLTHSNSTVKPLYEITLYLPEQTLREAIFTGAFPSAETLINLHQINYVRNISSFVADIKNKKDVVTIGRPHELLISLGHAVAESLKKENINIGFSESAKEAFVEARFVKRPEELELIAFSSRLAAWAHQEANKSIAHAENVNEISLSAEFSRLCSICGGSLQVTHFLI